MQNCAKTVGGTNFFLGLIEAIKEKKPNALIESSCKVESKELNITWNKIIFKDKSDLLEEVLRSHKSYEDQDFNILEDENQKKRKKILNMVKTLAPLEFRVSVKNSQEFAGFEFKVFESVDDDYVKINPVFAAIFFCSVEYTKKALKYQI